MVKLRETITVLNTGDSDSRCRDLARVPVADDQWQGLAMVAVVGWPWWPLQMAWVKMVKTTRPLDDFLMI